MKQVIVFNEYSKDDIQKTINSWIAANHTTNKILDIKLNSYTYTNNRSFGVHFTAMIIYDKKNSN
jgi:hypothetical protein